jgi:hypothetical protein
MAGRQEGRRAGGQEGMNAGRQAYVHKVKCSNMHMEVGTQYRIKKIESAKVQAYKFAQICLFKTRERKTFAVCT